MHERIKFECKNCGWKDSVVAAWKDLKPKRCPNKKCKTFFRKSPEALLITHPQPPQEDAQVEEMMEQDADESLKTEPKKRNHKNER